MGAGITEILQLGGKMLRPDIRGQDLIPGDFELESSALCYARPQREEGKKGKAKLSPWES